MGWHVSAEAPPTCFCALGFVVSGDLTAYQWGSVPSWGPSRKWQALEEAEVGEEWFSVNPPPLWFLVDLPERLRCAIPASKADGAAFFVWRQHR